MKYVIYIPNIPQAQFIYLWETNYAFKGSSSLILHEFILYSEFFWL